MSDFGGQSSTASLNAMLGAGSVFEGKLHFEGQVRIDGTFTGEITTKDLLVIGEGAKVSATINCGSVEIKGDITGHVNATESIVLRADRARPGRHLLAVAGHRQGRRLRGQHAYDERCAEHGHRRVGRSPPEEGQGSRASAASSFRAVGPQRKTATATRAASTRPSSPWPGSPSEVSNTRVGDAPDVMPAVHLWQKQTGSAGNAHRGSIGRLTTAHVIASPRTGSGARARRA